MILHLLWFIGHLFGLFSSWIRYVGISLDPNTGIGIYPIIYSSFPVVLTLIGIFSLFFYKQYQKPSIIFICVSVLNALFLSIDFMRMLINEIDLNMVDLSINKLNFASTSIILPTILSLLSITYFIFSSSSLIYLIKKQK
ncbi:TPA: hypothetical protein ACSPJ7_004745 [Bacillus cereus]